MKKGGAVDRRERQGELLEERRKPGWEPENQRRRERGHYLSEEIRRASEEISGTEAKRQQDRDQGDRQEGPRGLQWEQPGCKNQVIKGGGLSDWRPQQANWRQ